MRFFYIFFLATLFGINAFANDIISIKIESNGQSMHLQQNGKVEIWKNKEYKIEKQYKKLVTSLFEKCNKTQWPAQNTKLQKKSNKIVFLEVKGKAFSHSYSWERFKKAPSKAIKNLYRHLQDFHNILKFSLVKNKNSKKTITEVSFNSGGGFTGAYNGIDLKDDGTVKIWVSGAGMDQSKSYVYKDIVALLLTGLSNIKLEDIKLKSSRPGNINSSLTIKRKDKQFSFNWSYEASPKIQEITETLSSLRHLLSFCGK